jgi:hypothetical protein
MKRSRSTLAMTLAAAMLRLSASPWQSAHGALHREMRGAQNVQPVYFLHAGHRPADEQAAVCVQLCMDDLALFL